MLDTIKDLFSPKTALGLHVGKRTIRAVKVSNPSGTPTVERIASQEIRDPDRIPAEIAALVEREGLASEMVITSIPASSATIRQVAIPIDNPRKVRRIVKYQLEPFVPQPVETMVVDYIPGDPGKPLLVTGVEKSFLSERLLQLRNAGIDPGIVTIDAVALYGLCIRLGEGEGGAIAIIHKDQEKILLMIVNRGRLELLRILPGSKEILERIMQTLDLYGLKNPKDPLRSILLTGPGAADEPLFGELGKKCGVEVRLWRPFEHLKHGLGEIGTEAQAGLAVPLALAVGSFAAPLGNFNLLREEFASRGSAGIKGALGYMAAAILIFAALVTFTTFERLHISQRDYSALRSQVLAVFKGTCPDTPTIVKGMELEQMRQKISESTKEYQWLNSITARGPVLDVILVLSKNLGAFKDLKLDNISLEGKRVDLDGRASSFQTVDNLKAVLEKSGSFTQIKLVGAKMNNKDKLVSFNFVMERQV